MSYSISTQKDFLHYIDYYQLLYFLLITMQNKTIYKVKSIFSIITSKQNQKFILSHHINQKYDIKHIKALFY